MSCGSSVRLGNRTNRITWPLERALTARELERRAVVHLSPLLFFGGLRLCEQLVQRGFALALEPGWPTEPENAPDRVRLNPPATPETAPATR
jgi:hypothetical protein